MALIEIFHVVADHYEVDPDFTAQTLEGAVVGLTALGDKSVITAGNDANVFGIAGDTQSNDTAGTAYSDDLIIGAHGPVTNPVGKARSTSNRVSDFFNETLASGRMTVYTGGGKFASDQYDSGLTYAPGEALYALAGQLTNVDPGAGAVVGVVAEVPREYPSGVPGTDTPDGSLSLGSFLTFKLSI